MGTFVFYDRRDWSWESCYRNKAKGVILSLLWCTFVVPSVKNTALIFPGYFTIFSCKSPLRGGRGLLLGIFGGCAARISKSRPQTKKFHSPHPFSDLALKIHTRFQTWPCTWLSKAYASVLNGSQRYKDE